MTSRSTFDFDAIVHFKILTNADYTLNQSVANSAATSSDKAAAIATRW